MRSFINDQDAKRIQLTLEHFAAEQGVEISSHYVETRTGSKINSLQLRYRTTWIEVEEAPGPGGGGALPADDGAAQRPAVAVPAPPAAMTFGRGEELG